MRLQTRGMAIGAILAVALLGLVSSWLLANSAYGDSAPQLDQAPADYDVDLLIRPRDGAPEGTPPEFYFEPVGLSIQPGQTVRFRALTPHHTATAYHTQHVKQMRVPEGVPPFSSPIIPVGESWSYTFTQPGVYDLWCGPHEMFGMTIRIVVGEASGPATDPPADLGARGAFGAAGTVLSDPALAPARILEQGRVGWAELDPASKRIPSFLGGG